jgi:adenosylcobinamide-GDP ribazoletransferase
LSHIGKLYLSWYFKKHIGGYTGDCLGTVQQICEVLFYLIVIILWKFM